MARTYQVVKLAGVAMSINVYENAQFKYNFVAHPESSAYQEFLLAIELDPSKQLPDDTGPVVPTALNYQDTVPANFRDSFQGGIDTLKTYLDTPNAQVTQGQSVIAIKLLIRGLLYLFRATIR